MLFTNPALAAKTKGEIRVLYIRCDFPDDGLQRDHSAAQSQIDAASQFFAENSYGLVQLKASITPVLVLPEKKSVYEKGFGSGGPYVKNDSVAAAEKNGFHASDYDLLVTAAYIDQPTVGGYHTFLRNYADSATFIHELGHGFGLDHARGWSADAKSIIGSGRSIEYGNPFDEMGSAANWRGGGKSITDSYPGSFNVVFRHLLGWLPAGASTLSAEDIVNSEQLVAKLRARGDKVSDYLRDLLSNDLRKYLDTGAGFFPPGVLDRFLARDLDNIIHGESIFDENRFANVTVSLDTKMLLLGGAKEGNALLRLNRLLLEDAYPLELAKNRNIGFVQTIAESGIYRLSAFDVSSLTTGLTYALRIKRSSNLDYWLEFRQKPAIPFLGAGAKNPVNIENGVLIYWYHPGYSMESDLLDMNPDSLDLSGDSAQFLDAALTVGQTFVDTEAGFRLTPVQVNPGPHRSIDVAVQFIVPGELKLSVKAEGNRIILSWSDSAVALEEADDLAGPWKSVLDTSPRPYSILISSIQKFYRLRR